VARSVLCAASTVAVLRCPNEVGFAINSGDQEHRLSRVKFIMSEYGWAGVANYNDFIVSRRSPNGSFPSPVVVYSSVKRFSIRLGSSATTVPVTPCCGGMDYSANIADAQKMREHTWPLMLEQFPAETRWFVSTEDDVWWDVRRLCRVIDESVRRLGASESEPIVIGGGATDRQIIYGPYVIVNRPLLLLFSNARLLDRCRLELTSHNAFHDYVYPGAQYNLDHLISYCVFKCFPRLTGRTIHAYVKQSWPMKSGKRPEHFYHNGGAWQSSVRASCFLRSIAEFHPDEEVVAVHHTTIDDMDFLQQDLPLRNASHLNPAFAAYYRDHLKAACRNYPSSVLISEQNASNWTMIFWHRRTTAA